MKSICFSAAILLSAISVEAFEPVGPKNIVRTDSRCIRDYDCKVEDLDWIEGIGKPKYP